MRKNLLITLTIMMATIMANAKTLVVYYSYTNNVHTIVSDLRTQIDADVIRVEPAKKGVDYAANGYAVGSALISAIRNNPNDAASYSAIDPVEVNMADYDMVIVAAPLWWSQMAALLQTFLFQYGILEPNLWIRSAQTSNCHSLIEGWLKDIDYSHIATATATVDETMDTTVNMTTNGVQVVGDFEELAIFNMNGQKILETSASYTSYPFQVGCYIAQLRKVAFIQ